jgi:coenzyme F420-reducing hydrogenase delta subunit
MQRGISGCYKSGADAIIVSGERRGDDTFNTLKYVAEWRIGANSLFKSFVQQTTIRVFRSAKYVRQNNIYSSNAVDDICSTIDATIRCSSSNLYRYDGLYTIVQVKPPTGKHFVATKAK